MRCVKERERTICYRKKTNWRQFIYVCPVIDNEFRHNIVKVAVDPQITLTML